MAENKENKKDLKNWLDNLQQESWQLELLISGFTIFLLIGGWEPLNELEYELELLMGVSSTYFSLNFIYYVLRTAYLSLLCCLLIHVLLRGLWIAAIGLRSVSGEIDYEAFKYKDRFKNRLKRGIGFFDQYIERLERNCSVIFSLAFLIVFCFVSMTVWAITIKAIQAAALWLVGGEYQGTGIIGGAGLVSVAVVLLSFLYFLDFVTLGLLKRLRWVNRPYYYLYVFMGWVTLARLYRPLYYNLIDNRFGKRLAMLLPVVIFLIMAAVSAVHIKYTYLPAYLNDGKIWQSKNNYDDTKPDLSQQVWRMSLASKYPVNNYVEAFVPYQPRWHDEVLLAIDSTLDISRYTGTKFYGAIVLGTRYNDDADYGPIKKAFEEKHQIYLNDSLITNLDPLFTFHETRRQPGLVFMLPTHYLPLGRHALMLKTQFLENGVLEWSDGYTIYFYK